MSSQLTGIEYILCDAAALWRKAYNQASKHLKLTEHERRLLVILDRHANASQVALAALAGCEPQNLIRLLDSLEKKSLIARQACAVDRRVKRIVLTTPGKKKVTAIKILGDQLRPLITKTLSERELTQLTQTLGKLCAALEWV